MPRRVRGVLAVEGIETGDGRLIVAGALDWSPLPLPLAWITGGDQHIDMLGEAPVVGNIDAITRANNGEVTFTGVVDDESEAGAELVRQLEAGTAALGNRVGLSVDPDDYAVEIILTDAAEEGVLVASGRPLFTISGEGVLTRAHVGALVAQARGVQAAAGDPDPGEGGGADGIVLFEDESGSIIERYTRLRIRGATCCAVAAFDGAYLELDGEAATEPAPATVAASAAPHRPPAAWFSIPEPSVTDRGMIDVYGMPAEELLVEQPDGGLGVPLTITADGLVFGHAARWGQCHVGYGGACVTPPTSASAYAHFHVGAVECEDGAQVATGALTVGCDHAGERMGYSAARDHYAHSGLGWADVRATNGELGVWVSGALRPDVDESQLRVLRALSLSGDWRRIGGQLEFIAALAVNVPGFPIAREAVTASGLGVVDGASPRAFIDGDAVQQTLLASGVVHRCADCQRRASLAAGGIQSVPGDGYLAEQLDAVVAGVERTIELMRTLEYRTRPMLESARDEALARIRR